MAMLPVLVIINGYEIIYTARLPPPPQKKSVTIQRIFKCLQA